MQVRFEQLEAHLANALARSNGSLAPVYVIHGDEPLLALEAADAVRAAARQRGFTEREVFEPDRHFDWSEFTHSASSLSLFASRKLIELRLPTGKPGPQGSEAIAAYCNKAPGPDNLLLVSLPRLDRAGRNSAWFTALAQAGVQVEVWPLERARMPAWIAARLARQKQSAPADVLELIADRVEGNLLAARQEVQKLALLAPEGALSLETVMEVIASVARYDSDIAVTALLVGDMARYVRIIEGLRDEGESPTYVVTAIAKAIFVIDGLQAGGNPYALFGQNRLFNKALQEQVQEAAKRFSESQLAEMIRHVGAIDRAIKGVGTGEPWDQFITLGLKLGNYHLDIVR